MQIVESVELTPDLEAPEERRCSGRRALVGHCKVFVQPIFSLFSVYFPDICVQTGIGYLSTVLDSVGIPQSGISVVLH